MNHLRYHVGYNIPKAGKCINAVLRCFLIYLYDGKLFDMGIWRQRKYFLNL
jgi:hypothetical protein